MLTLGMIHKIFQGEVKVEEQSVIVKENIDDVDQLIFDVDRGKIYFYITYYIYIYNLYNYCF